MAPPACAGKTLDEKGREVLSQSPPRVRGEDAFLSLVKVECFEPPPRARGRRGRAVQRQGTRRNTPRVRGEDWTLW